jgi:hypothetical protein
MHTKLNKSKIIMTNRLNKPQTAELALHFHKEGDRLKGVSSFYALDIFKGAAVTAFTKKHPDGINVWVAYPNDYIGNRLPIEVEEIPISPFNPPSGAFYAADRALKDQLI